MLPFSETEQTKMRVLKFGGTSLGTPERMKSIVPLVRNNSRDQNLVVLSAVSGTTNQLVKICELSFSGESALAEKEIEQLKAHYFQYINELLTSAEKRQAAERYISNSLYTISQFSKRVFTSVEEGITLAQGELISTFLFKLHLDEIGIQAALLPALDFMRVNEDHEPRLDYLSKKLSAQISQSPQVELFITQGYICLNNAGEVDNLKRGGSDYTACLIGAALEVEEIQIWTDIDGMQNNDPRFVRHTKSIAELSFDEAAELAYFGAKILHPTCILPAKKANVPVRLKNTMNPNSEGTFISTRSNSDTIKAIAAKDGITAIRIKSGRMLMAYGFLKKTFEVFEKYKTSIDTVTTSEVAVSLTIDDPTHLEEIVEELKVMATVEVDKALSIICIVGDFLADEPGHLGKISSALSEVPIRMVSYGGSPNNVSLLVKTEDKRNALIALNEGLFELMEREPLAV